MKIYNVSDKPQVKYNLCSYAHCKIRLMQVLIGDVALTCYAF